MKQSVKKIVRELPGLTSYCACLKTCTNVEVDHVIPKHLLKKSLVKNVLFENPQKSLYNKSINDMHNLYRCCTKMNRPKSNKILGQNWDAKEHNSYLARAALYMDMQYELNVSEDLLLIWKNMALQTEVLDFEKERNDIIMSHQNQSNPFITELPSFIVYYS